MTETIISPNKVYSLALPEGYVFEESDESVIVYSPHGRGAINITSYDIPSGYAFNIEEELRDFSLSIDNDINPRNLPVQNNGYAYCQFMSQGKFWKIWVFFKNYQAVFATYNCDKKDNDHEINKVDKIMESLRIIIKDKA